MAQSPIAAISTLGEYRAAGVVLFSHCSAGGHQHRLDLDALIIEHGSDREIDRALKTGLRCPVCGAPGAGVEVWLGPHLSPRRYQRLPHLASDGKASGSGVLLNRLGSARIFSTAVISFSGPAVKRVASAAPSAFAIFSALSVGSWSKKTKYLTSCLTTLTPMKRSWDFVCAQNNHNIGVGSARCE
jgi:hypothetical protein